MKNLFKTTLLVTLMAITLPVASEAMSILPGNGTTPKTETEQSQRLINRLEEIKSMDLKSLTRKERRELKHEVKSIQKELHTNSSGVYISVGAIIIILLLLILLL